MPARFSPRIFIALCLATTAACSSGSSGSFYGEDGGAPSPTPTASGTTTTDPPKDKPDAAPESKPDAAPTVDKTVHFDLTLEGQPITIAQSTVKVKVEAGSNGNPPGLVIDGSYEQTGVGAFTSTATFTVRVDTTTKGADACGTGGRSAGYWFKDTDGTIRGLGTVYQGGNCTMNVVANAADGFTSGTATGVVGGAKQKAFTVRWGQPLPSK